MTSTKNPSPTLVFTRCAFFQDEDTTRLEQQVNYFLNNAPLAALHRSETNVIGEKVLITLWFEPMPGASDVGSVYERSLLEGAPRGGAPEDMIEDEDEDD